MNDDKRMSGYSHEEVKLIQDYGHWIKYPDRPAVPLTREQIIRVERIMEIPREASMVEFASPNLSIEYITDKRCPTYYNPNFKYPEPSEEVSLKMQELKEKIISGFTPPLPPVAIVKRACDGLDASPTDVMSRMLSAEDKKELFDGKITVEQLRVAIECWIESGKRN